MSISFKVFVLLMFFFSTMGLVKMNKYMLMILLSLEMMVLSLFMFFILGIWGGGAGIESYVLVYFLICSVCEGVLGLVIVVMFTRDWGGDQVHSLIVLN